MIDRVLQTQLEPLARASQRWRLWRALAVCWAALAAVGLFLVLVHHFTGWSAPWTGPALIVSGVFAAGITLVRFLNIPPDYRALAREIERENPELHVVLLTAVEQQPEAGGELNYLQQRVIEEALKHHQRSPWGKRIAERLFASRCAHWAALGIFVLSLAALRSRTPRPGELWAGAEHSSGVVVTPGDTTLERGSGLVVLARFDGKLPSEAALIVKPVNENERTIPLTKNLSDPVFGGGISEVKGDASYRIEYSTGRTRDFKVTVFDYPKLDHADARISYPAYTGIPEKTVPDTRRVSAVEGSTIDYSFFLNKPVVTAKLVAKDSSEVLLTADTNNPSVRHTRINLDASRRFELVLMDDAGRTNKLPPEFVIDALKNRPAELKLVTPRGDQRVSALAEIPFQAEVSDDFGLRAYGITYALADGETQTIELGKNTGPNEKRQLNYLLALENLGAQPDQLLSYYIWADDLGPDGKIRRTSGDMFFAEIKPFDEIFRESQSPESNQQQSESQQQQGSESQKLSELQKQIISATWNLKRRETAPEPSVKYKEDAGVVRDSQKDALDQLHTLQEKLKDDRLKGFASKAEKEMELAEKELNTATDKNALPPLTPALAHEQAASQALMRLQAREYQVARNNRSQRGGRSSGQRNQEQLDELDLKQTENRYETQKDAAPEQKPEQREQLQVANRLKELAQRQADVNERLKELQTALQEAKTDKEREEVRDRLKRLREEQQDLLADVDELRQRMDRPENQSRMSDAKQQLDQTRSQVENAQQALNKDSVPQALAAGTRAQQQLKQLEQDFRKQNSSQFSEQMRQMRDHARELAQNEQQIAKKLDDLGDPKQKTLSDSDARRELASKLEQQKPALTNLYEQMRQVSEQSETAEPLLSKQLYDLVRQSKQEDMNKSLDLSSELVRRGFVSESGQFEQRARTNIDQLKQGVEHAAESVLGDEAEALRLAKRELEELSRQLDDELAQATSGNGTNGAGRNANGAEGRSGSPVAARDRRTAGGQSASSQNTNSPAEGQRGQEQANQNGEGQNQQTQPGEQPAGQQPGQQGQQANDGQRQQGRQNGQGGQRGQNGNRPGDGQRGQGAPQQASTGEQQQPGGQPQETASEGQGQQPGNESAGNEGGGRNATRTAGARNRAGANGGYGGGGSYGPLAGENFVDWSDRLRNVEEMVDAPDLRSEVARIRDRARAVRLEYKKSGKKPDWDVVKTQISEPLAEVRSRVSEELARRESKDALVPLDRDPVPAQFSELVRRYYEQLGKSE